MTSYNFYSIRYAYRFLTCQKTEPKTDSLYRCARLTAYRCTRLVITLFDDFTLSDDEFQGIGAATEKFLHPIYIFSSSWKKEDKNLMTKVAQSLHVNINILVALMKVIGN